LLGNTSEYYAVPEIFGKNKKNAEHFAFYGIVKLRKQI